MAITNKKKVVLGMSAGVDSTVAAVLLQKQGYEVVGVFMHFWKEESSDKSKENKCCSMESYEELKKICRQLDIKFVTANVEKEFKKEIVDYFLREYKLGRTPNPCIVCNQEIKFKILLKKMLEFKADFVATGHYARIKREIINSKLKISNKLKIKNQKSKKAYKLFEGKDKEKDQSYFLYGLNQRQLARILFPVGEYNKPEVRKLAKKFKLSVHNKKESQDICFINSSVEKFLKNHLKLKKGKMTNQAGEVIGEHSGLPLYTLGQRKGINIGGDGPYYVSKKDFQKNILQVTNQKEEKSLYREEMNLDKVHWISDLKLEFPLKIKLRIRYRNPLVSAIIELKNKKFLVKFDKSQKGVTPGQFAVFYGKGGEVLGGGIIK